MNTRRLVTPASCVAALLFVAAGGCQVDHSANDGARADATTDVAGPTTMVAEAPAVPPAEGVPPDQAMYNLSRLEALPPAVQRAFRRQHGRDAAGVTHVDIQPLETGPNAYRVSYIGEGGTPGVDVYHEDGRLIEPGARRPLDWTFWVSTR